MATSKNTKLFGREELKKYFRNGQVPDEKIYEQLLDSVLIKHDDGFSNDPENGFVISPIDASKKLLTFYEKIDRLQPFYVFEKDQTGNPSLRLLPGMDTTSDDSKSFYFHQNGNFGIGMRNSEKNKLEVNGFMASTGRIGNYREGTVKADGKWHPIVGTTEIDKATKKEIMHGMNNCHVFEVVARTGKTGTGKFAMLHATAVSAFGGSHNKIRKTCAFHGFFWNKLNLRWRGDTQNYILELRSNRNYGNDVDIFYRVGKLWDDEQFTTSEYFYKENQGI